MTDTGMFLIRAILAVVFIYHGSQFTVSNLVAEAKTESLGGRFSLSTASPRRQA